MFIINNLLVEVSPWGTRASRSARHLTPCSKRILKLREFGDGTAAELIYYERPDKAGPKTSKYTRTQISDAASMRETKSLGKSLAKFW
jgi:hypothetical protein